MITIIYTIEFWFGVLIWFIIWYSIWFLVCKKILISIERTLWIFLFFVRVAMIVYWFFNHIEVPIIFDIISAGSAAAMLWIKVNEKFVDVIIEKITLKIKSDK